MAIAFIDKKKKQKKLLVVAVILLMVTAAILIQWLVRKNLPEQFANQTISPTFRHPDIDFSVLENQALKDLEPFEGIDPFEGKMGRENPFVPY